MADSLKKKSKNDFDNLMVIFFNYYGISLVNLIVHGLIVLNVIVVPNFFDFKRGEEVHIVMGSEEFQKNM